MKHFLLFIGIVLFTQSAFGQLNFWRWQNPSVQGSTLTAVQMYSMKRTFACGNRGTVIKTADGGATWDVKNLLLLDSLNLYGINFLDSNYGMVCGENGAIFKTTDGGNTWVQLNSTTTLRLEGIVVLDTNIAVAVGRSGMILRTTDGGNNWHSVPLESAPEFTGIRKLRPDFLTITGQKGILYKSVDLGFTWKQIIIRSDTNVIANDINGQVFYDDNTGILIGDLGGVFSTTDGGNSWTNRSVQSIAAALLNAIDGKDPSGKSYTIVGNNGTILNSSNGGNSWSKAKIDFFDSIRAISYFDQLNAVAVGRDGLIISTTDGGASWKFLPSEPITEPLNGVAFPKGDTSLGIAVGNAGTIMRTTDGGSHWILTQGGTAQALNSVTFLNPNEICAVGQKGTILISHDAGQNWTQKISGTSKYLKSVSFPTPNFGWAVGDSGIVLSSVNGGASWILHPFSKKRFFTGISFSDSLHGYMCCEHGVYITTDGGVTWADPDDVTYYINCTGISSPSPNVVTFTYLPCEIVGDKDKPWVLLVPGGIMTSHDDGKNWQNTDFFNFLYNVSFTDDLHGTAVGLIFRDKDPNGFITHTTDGGITWNRQDSHTRDILYGVSYGTAKAGTVVGTKGNILRITTDE